MPGLPMKSAHVAITEVGYGILILLGILTTYILPDYRYYVLSFVIGLCVGYTIIIASWMHEYAIHIEKR